MAKKKQKRANESQNIWLADNSYNLTKKNSQKLAKIFGWHQDFHCIKKNRNGVGMERGGDMTNVREVFLRMFALTIQILIRKIFCLGVRRASGGAGECKYATIFQTFNWVRIIFIGDRKNKRKDF